MAHPYWPLFDLLLHTQNLLLRPMSEKDQALLADRLPDGVALDPAAMRLAGVGRRHTRGVILYQDYWSAYGSWRPEHWRLPFGVWERGELIGAQTLEADDFLGVRTVDTSSFLVAERRGLGLGKQMRRAVLTLAFGPLAAQAAITEAWHYNRASLGVSRAVGYLPNGESLHRRDEGDDIPGHYGASSAHPVRLGHLGAGGRRRDRRLRALPPALRPLISAGLSPRRFDRNSSSPLVFLLSSWYLRSLVWSR